MGLRKQVFYRVMSIIAPIAHISTYYLLTKSRTLQSLRCLSRNAGSVGSTGDKVSRFRILDFGIRRVR